MHTKRVFLVALVASGGLAGCSDNTSEVDARVRFEVKPGVLRECEPPVVATLTWDVSAAGLETVKIFVVDDKGKEKLFAEQGRSGTASTGPWTSPGMIFLLKSPSGNKTIGRIVVGSQKC